MTTITSTSPRAATWGPFQYEDMESLSRLISTLTIGPIHSLACFFFPSFGAGLSNYQHLRESDTTQNSPLPLLHKENLFREIRELKSYAGLDREISVYFGSINHPHSYGGQFSFTDSLVAIPTDWVIRPNGKIFGSKESATHDFSNENDKDLYSDDETRFFIAREIGYIKRNDALFPLLTRIILLCASLFFYFAPYSWLICLGIAACAIGLNILSERINQKEMDFAAINILAQKLGDTEKAKQVAIRALSKIQKKNIERRTYNKITRLYVRENGDNMLNFLCPTLSSRIQSIRDWKSKSVISNSAKTNKAANEQSIHLPPCGYLLQGSGVAQMPILCV